MTLTPYNAGWIEVICGSMFSGKTEELIRRLRRAEIAQLSVVIFKPKVDNRFSKNFIVSHNKTKMKSIIIENVENIISQSKKYDVIGIDEAQFFDKTIVTISKELAKNNKRVIIAGLDSDYQGLPFGPMPDLMCEAEYVDKLRAICIQCGNPASYSQRISSDLGKVVLGELDKYEARCRNCFKEPKIN